VTIIYYLRSMSIHSLWIQRKTNPKREMTQCIRFYWLSVSQHYIMCWRYITIACSTLTMSGAHQEMDASFFTPCNVACSSGFVTLNSPHGSTLQCGRWLWDDMPLNSPKCPPYWNSTPGFDFDHITTVDMSFCTSLQNFIQIGPPSAEKMTMSMKMSIFKMADFGHLGF